jgi:hypothetical protein
LVRGARQRSQGPSRQKRVGARASMNRGWGSGVPLVGPDQ